MHQKFVCEQHAHYFSLKRIENKLYDFESKSGQGPHPYENLISFCSIYKLSLNLIPLFWNYLVGQMHSRSIEPPANWPSTAGQNSRFYLRQNTDWCVTHVELFLRICKDLWANFPWGSVKIVPLLRKDNCRSYWLCFNGWNLKCGNLMGW